MPTTPANLDKLTQVAAHSTKLLEAGCIVTMCIVTYSKAQGLDWNLTWPLLAGGAAY